MTRRTPNLAAAMTAVLTGLALAACGSDGSDGGGGDFADGSVDQIKEAAIADMKALESMTLHGSLVQEADELELTLSMDTDGNCVGTMTQTGGTAEFIGAGGDFYLKGDEAFWRSNTDPAQADATIALVGDNWVNLGAGGGGFSDFCDLDSMVADFDDEDDAGKKYTKGDETTVDGENAVEVITKDGEETTTALVATEGEHYILEVSNEGGDEPGSFTLSDFNEPVDAKAPDDADVVDLPQGG